MLMLSLVLLSYLVYGVVVARAIKRQRDRKAGLAALLTTLLLIPVMFVPYRRASLSVAIANFMSATEVVELKSAILVAVFVPPLMGGLSTMWLMRRSDRSGRELTNS